MWQSLIGKSLTQEQYDDYISALSNMMESLKLLFMIVDRDPFTEVITPPPVDVPDGFKTVWNFESGETLVLPLPALDIATPYNFTVYWGDETSNTITSYNDPDISHTYTTGGTYTVTIVGTCQGWSFDYNSTSSSKLIQVLSWGDPTLFSGFFHLSGGFSGANNLTSLPDGSDGYGTSIPAFGLAVINFGYTFRNCTSLTSIPTGLFDNNSSVITFNNTFQNCTSLTSIPTGLFINNTLVTDFITTFAECTSLTSIPTGLFDNNTEVTTFQQTFLNCTALTSIPT